MHTSWWACISTKQLNSIALVSAPLAEATLKQLLVQNILLPTPKSEKRPLFGVHGCLTLCDCRNIAVHKNYLYCRFFQLIILKKKTNRVTNVNYCKLFFLSLCSVPFVFVVCLLACTLSIMPTNLLWWMRSVTYLNVCEITSPRVIKVFEIEPHWTKKTYFQHFCWKI